MVLRGFSKNWLKVLADAFVATQSGMRGPIVSAISAYAAISDPAVLTSFLKDALGKYVEVCLLPFLVMMCVHPRKTYF